MKLKWALIFLVAVAILGIYTYRQMQAPFERGESVPEFSLMDLSGKTVRLSAYKGGPVLVHFFASWCSVCAQEFPGLEKFTKDFPQIKLAAISEDEGGADIVIKFLGGKVPLFDVLLDEEGIVADKYKSYMVPETFLVDREGRFLTNFRGAVDWQDRRVREKVLSEFGIPTK